MIETGSGEAADALRQALEGEGWEVDVIEERVSLCLLLEEHFDTRTEEWTELDDPYLIAVHFGFDESGPDSWLLVLETPTVVALGDVAGLMEMLDEDEDLEGLFVNNDGETSVQIVQRLDLLPREGPDAVGLAMRWFMEIVTEYGPTGLRFAGIDEEDAGATTPGFVQLVRGEQAYNDNDNGTAAQFYAQASAIFAGAHLQEHRVTADALEAIVVMTRGQPEQALSRLERCEVELAALDVDPWLPAMVIAMQGACLSYLGDLERADERFARSQRMAEIDDMDELWELVRAMLPDAASEISREVTSKKRLIESGGDPEKDLQSHMLLSVHHRRLGDFEKALEHLERADLLAVESGDHGSRFAIRADQCSLLLAADREEEARAVYEWLTLAPPPEHIPEPFLDLLSTQLGVVFGDASRSDGYTKGDFDLGRLGILADLTADATAAARSGEPLTGAKTVEFFEQAKEALASTGDDMATAYAYAVLAKSRLRTLVRQPGPDARREVHRALDELLAAIAHHDRARHQLTSPQDRERYATQIVESYEMALSIAVDLSMPALVAELLHRLQVLGLPDLSGGGPVLLPVAEPEHRTVDGDSRLAPGATDASLEQLIAIQAGANAWWWSMWRGSQFLVWASRSPEGRFDAGVVALDPDAKREEVSDALGPMFAPLVNRHFRHGPLQQYLDALRYDLPVGGDRVRSDADDPLSGLLGADHETGLATLAALGELLVPAGIKSAIDRADRDRPIRILYSPAPSLSWLPVGLLAVGKGSVQLVERAVVQAMAQPIEHEPSPPRGTTHGLLAVVDPSEDLEELRPLASEATLLLGGPSVVETHRSTGATLATRDSLLMSLAGADRYRAFLFAGHASPATDADPLAAGIEIDVNRSVVTVRDLIEQGTRLRPPAIAVLCACATAASRPSPATEAWSLPTALLLAGSEVVVATTWDLRVCAATTQFVVDLLTAIQNDPTDVPTALRQVQLDRLDRWRLDIVRGDVGTTTDRPGGNQPFLWAPFVVIQSNATMTGPGR